jgi:hypothetical protein
MRSIGLRRPRRHGGLQLKRKSRIYRPKEERDRMNRKAQSGTRTLFNPVHPVHPVKTSFSPDRSIGCLRERHWVRQGR